MGGEVYPPLAAPKATRGKGEGGSVAFSEPLYCTGAVSGLGAGVTSSCP